MEKDTEGVIRLSGTRVPLDTVIAAFLEGATAGVLEVGREVPIWLAVEDVLLITECGRENEWEGQVRYLPWP